VDELRHPRSADTVCGSSATAAAMNRLLGNLVQSFSTGSAAALTRATELTEADCPGSSRLKQFFSLASEPRWRGSRARMGQVW
jgi:hypothetical protein